MANYIHYGVLLIAQQSKIKNPTYEEETCKLNIH